MHPLTKQAVKQFPQQVLFARPSPAPQPVTSNLTSHERTTTQTPQKRRPAIPCFWSTSESKKARSPEPHLGAAGHWLPWILLSLSCKAEYCGHTVFSRTSYLNPYHSTSVNSFRIFILLVNRLLFSPIKLISDMQYANFQSQRLIEIQREALALPGGLLLECAC